MPAEQLEQRAPAERVELPAKPRLRALPERQFGRLPGLQRHEPPPNDVAPDAGAYASLADGLLAWVAVGPTDGGGRDRLRPGKKRGRNLEPSLAMELLGYGLALQVLARRATRNLGQRLDPVDREPHHQMPIHGHLLNASTGDHRCPETPLRRQS